MRFSTRLLLLRACCCFYSPLPVACTSQGPSYIFSRQARPGQAVPSPPAPRNAVCLHLRPCELSSSFLRAAVLPLPSPTPSIPTPPSSSPQQRIQPTTDARGRERERRSSGMTAR
ncbi:hypothetical protein GGR56DRAFT_251570 [Xylariaceae sp. FL0804]|nr:hypothetical protein GGR56DRAFT_251570 [Xylariaceae sp. FL0804]